jgi:hypothetical protein
MRSPLLARLVLAAALMTSGACADAVTAPPSIDPAIAARVLPPLEDARLRISGNLENTGVRERVTYDLEQIEAALAQGDAHKARYHVHLAATILGDYKKGLGPLMRDGSEVSAIALVLHSVAIAVGGGFDIANFT